MRLCKECPEYDSCTTPCPEVEEYINQDHVNKSYLTFSELGLDNIEIEEEEQWQNTYTKYNKIIDAYEIGIPIKEIAKYFSNSSSYIYKVIQDYKERGKL